MRKTLVLLALAGLLALSAAVFGSPPTKAKTLKKTLIVKTEKAVTISTADTSAVAPRDAEARTVETGNLQTMNSNDLAAGNAYHALGVETGDYMSAQRYAVGPPDLGKGSAEARTNAARMTDYNPNTSAPAGYVMRR